MSEYPELNDYEPPVDGASDELSGKDLATRERELLGDAGAAELIGDDADAGTEAFSEPEQVAEETFVAAETSGADEQSTGSASNGQRAPGAGPQAYVPERVDLSQSEFLKDWKVKRDLEIERRDKVSADKLEETREKARKAIDDFYENYNSKKEKEAGKVHTDAEEFAKKRDAEIGSGKGTTWDRVAQLMDGLGRPAAGVAPSDKKRFAELVQSLKGDANAPGAAGY